MVIKLLLVVVSSIVFLGCGVRLRSKPANLPSPTMDPLAVLQQFRDPKFDDVREDAITANVLIQIIGLEAYYVEDRRLEPLKKWLDRVWLTEDEVLGKESKLEEILISTFHFDLRDGVQKKALHGVSEKIRRTLTNIAW